MWQEVARRNVALSMRDREPVKKSRVVITSNRWIRDRGRLLMDKMKEMPRAEIGNKKRVVTVESESRIPTMITTLYRL